jgi:hypothetical protein
MHRERGKCHCAETSDGQELCQQRVSSQTASICTKSTITPNWSARYCVRCRTSPRICSQTARGMSMSSRSRNARLCGIQTDPWRRLARIDIMVAASKARSALRRSGPSTNSFHAPRTGTSSPGGNSVAFRSRKSHSTCHCRKPGSPALPSKGSGTSWPSSARTPPLSSASAARVRAAWVGPSVGAQSASTWRMRPRRSSAGKFVSSTMAPIVSRRSRRPCADWVKRFCARSWACRTRSTARRPAMCSA